MGRIYHYDKSSLKLISYEQFWNNLEKMNKEGKISIEKLYASYNTPYLLSDLSPFSMVDLLHRMRIDKDLFDTYYKNNLYTD